MKARRLPSGRWRVRTSVNGIRKSFTADSKAEAEYLAHAYLAGRRREPSGLTVGTAIRSYIDDRAPVLSPSTVQGYESLARNAYDGIAQVKVDELTDAAVQRWVSAYAAQKSPKRVRNAYGLLAAALAQARPDKTIKARLPQPVKYDAHTPNAEDVARLLKYIQGRDPLLYAAVLLGAFVPMRRGEVCALKGRDVDHRSGAVTVRENIVPKDGGGYAVKQPKTAAGYRTVTLPRQIMEQLPIVKKDELVVPLAPWTLSHRFSMAAKACGLDGVHFHSLRHFGASILHAWNVPDQVVMRRGGWSSSETMRRIYRESLSSEERRITQTINRNIDMIFEQVDTQMDTNESE